MAKIHHTSFEPVDEASQKTLDNMVLRCVVEFQPGEVSQQTPFDLAVTLREGAQISGANWLMTGKTIEVIDKQRVDVAIYFCRRTAAIAEYYAPITADIRLAPAGFADQAQISFQPRPKMPFRQSCG
ncbi:MAG: hypothetical protein ACPGNV_07680 [Mangrovicoccus sp.]